MPVGDTVKVDTRHQHVRTDNGWSVLFHGFERHVVRGVARAAFVGGLEADDVTLAYVGSASVRLGRGADRLVLKRSCLQRARGEAGSDRIHIREQSCTRAARVWGDEGDDRMSGSPRRDVLIGGSGRDLADGRGGNDTCIAEVRRRCEQP